MTKLQKLTLVITLILSIINMLLILSIKTDTLYTRTAIEQADMWVEEY